MSSSQKTLLVLLLGVVLGLSSHRFIGTLEAAPSDIMGSPNIAVRSYRTTKGTFVLWSDAHISAAIETKAKRPPGTIVTATDAYEDRTEPPQRPKGRPIGSPNVPVDVVQDSEGTVVLFADGTTRKPQDAEASAPGVRLSNVTWGQVTHAGVVVSGSDDFTVDLSDPYAIIIRFDDPYDKPPAVTATAVDGQMRCRAKPKRDQVYVNFITNETNDATVAGRADFSFVSVGE